MRSRQAGIVNPTVREYDITLAEIMSMPAAYIGFGTIGDRRSHLTPEFTNGTMNTPETLAAFVTAYEPTPAAQRLRERMTEDIAISTSKTRPRRQSHRAHGERVGDPLEYERFRLGHTREQLFWEQRTRVEHRRTGTLVMHCNIGLNGGEPTSNLEWSGACALALTDLLESMGYRVEMFGVLDSAKHPGGTLKVRVAVKQANERLTQQATAIISHGGVRRACWWTHLASLTDFRVSHSLGSPMEYTGSKTAHITVPKYITTEAQAAEFIEGVMRQYAGDK